MGSIYVAGLTAQEAHSKPEKEKAEKAQGLTVTIDHDSGELIKVTQPSSMSMSPQRVVSLLGLVFPSIAHPLVCRHILWQPAHTTMAHANARQNASCCADRARSTYG
jgi:hypothetical protein